MAVEGDWPDCFEVNAAIKQDDVTYGTVPQLLRTFNRWSTWMWGNWEIAGLVEWLHTHNRRLSVEQRVGFYGLDVYSLWESLQEIMHYVKKQGDGAVQAAQRAFPVLRALRQRPTGICAGHCLRFRRLSGRGKPHAARPASANRQPATHGLADREARFAADQNALVAVNAERYYRAMLRGGSTSWNVRDTHMMETLTRLLDLHGPASKAIVWEHNTHAGDARYTDMRREDMVNVGQLAREAYGRENVFIAGFGSYQGSVIAGKKWGATPEKMTVPTAPRDSWENRLRQQLAGDNALLLSSELRDYPELQQPIGHRAIGVVYRPEFERFGNYVPSLIPDRYDAFLFIDQTQALHPLSSE